MTRAQIVTVTAKAARAVAENRTGVAPRNEKHVHRLAELKAQAKIQRERDRVASDQPHA